MCYSLLFMALFLFNATILKYPVRDNNNNILVLISGNPVPTQDVERSKKIDQSAETKIKTTRTEKRGSLGFQVFFI